MCNFCKMISVDHGRWDENEDEKRPVMRSRKPKLSMEWQRFVDLEFLPEHLSSVFPRQCRVEQGMGMLDARSHDIKLLGKREDIFSHRLTLSGVANECAVGWITAGQKSKSPNAGRVFECDPGESMGWCNKPSLPLHFDISAKKEINSTTPWLGHDDGFIQSSGAAYHSATVDAGENGTVSHKNICKLRRASNEEGTPAMTCSEETDHIPIIENELTKSELQQQMANSGGSGSGRFAVRPIELNVNDIAKTCIDVISRALNLLVTASATGDMKIGSRTIHVPKCVRWIHSAFALDHRQWATHIHMMRNGAVGHNNEPAIISANRRSNSTEEEFIFDSGAEEHVTGNFALLSRLTAVEKGRGVVTASGHFMPALCSGSLITDGFRVNDLLLVPGMAGTIFSVSKLDDLGYSTEFTCRECLVRDARTRNLVGKGYRVSGLYKVDYLEIPLERRAMVAQRPAP